MYPVSFVSSIPGFDPAPIETKTDISTWRVSGIKDLIFTGAVLKQKNILVFPQAETAKDISKK